MKYLKLIVMLVLVQSSVISRAAWAWGEHRAFPRADFRHSGHARFVRPHYGVFIGVPLWRPLYYPVPYYYYPPAAVAPASPPAYIEQDNAQAAESNYWYYCTNPEGYYPYVKQCPGGWQKVVPQPPPS
jgi:hypothetical protein